LLKKIHLCLELLRVLPNVWPRGGDHGLPEGTARIGRWEVGVAEVVHSYAGRVASSTGRANDLRHTANLLAASSGANTAELMARMGHSSPVPPFATSTRRKSATRRSRRPCRPWSTPRSRPPRWPG
jgi:hypothetical protein